MARIKTVAIYGLVAIVNFIINFCVYNYSFLRQATPFLHEEQRVDSAHMMLHTTIPGFFAVAVVFALFYYALRKRFL